MRSALNKKHLCLLILFVSNIGYTQSTFMFEYDMQFNHDNYESAALYNHKCQLYINKKEALYTYRNAISLSDDPNVKKITTHVYIDVFAGESKVDYLELAEEGFQVYNKEDSFVNREIIDQKVYIIKEQLDTHDWEFFDSTKFIQGHTCFFAKKQHRGRTYCAWFTPEIDKDFHKGPWKLQGLPGLVVKAYSSDGALKFDLRDIEPKEIEYKILPPSDGKIIDLSEYWELYMKFRKTDFDRAHNGIIKNMIKAGIDPSIYKFPIFHNSMEILDSDLSKFKKWATVKK